jgi:hypothetical protein
MHEENVGMEGAFVRTPSGFERTLTGAVHAVEWNLSGCTL